MNTHYGARDGTWTRTGLPHAPQTCASADSATLAFNCRSLAERLVLYQIRSCLSTVFFNYFTAALSDFYLSVLSPFCPCDIPPILWISHKNHCIYFSFMINLSKRRWVHWKRFYLLFRLLFWFFLPWVFRLLPQITERDSFVFGKIFRFFSFIIAAIKG